MTEDADLAAVIARAQDVGRLAVLTIAGHMSLRALTGDDEVRQAAERVKDAAGPILARIVVGLALVTGRAFLEILGDLGFPADMLDQDQAAGYAGLATQLEGRYGPPERWQEEGRAMLERLVPQPIMSFGADFRVNLRGEVSGAPPASGGQ